MLTQHDSYQICTNNKPALIGYSPESPSTTATFFSPSRRSTDPSPYPFVAASIACVQTFKVDAFLTALPSRRVLAPPCASEGRESQQASGSCSKQPRLLAAPYPLSLGDTCLALADARLMGRSSVLLVPTPNSQPALKTNLTLRPIKTCH